MEIDELLEKLFSKRAEMKMLAQETDEIADQILEITNPGQSYENSRFRMRVSKPRVSVNILDENTIPSGFMHLRVNKSAIREHFRETGEELAGVECVPAKPTVTVMERSNA